MRDLEKIKERIESARAEMRYKSPLEIVLFIFVFFVAIALIVMIALAIHTQNTLYWLISIGATAVFIFTLSMDAHAKNKRSLKVLENPDALKGEGYVAYSVLYIRTETKKSTRSTYRTAIITEDSDRPLIAITTRQYNEFEAVNILYLPDYRYCCVVD